MMGSSLPPRTPKLSLPQVTLCAAASVNVSATLRALEVSLDQIDCASCKLFTDAPVTPANPDISVVPIARIESAAAYSSFLLSQMVDHIDTSHCLVAQWDGHVIHATRWRLDFLDYDYVGARWPQFDDGHDVGNGGFSLRSRRLMEACRAAEFRAAHPEDLAIGRGNRAWLEEQGMRFAPPWLADLFATERAGDIEASFGYHGVFNMAKAIGVEPFWQILRTLDDRSTVRHDFAAILMDLSHGKGGASRVTRMMAAHLAQGLWRSEWR